MSKSLSASPLSFLCFVVLACSAVWPIPTRCREATFGRAPARTQTPTDPTSVPADLGELFSQIWSAAKGGDKVKLTGIFQSLEIPDYKQWFEENFGSDDGSKLAAAYEKDLAAGYQFLVDSLVSASASDGRIVPFTLPSQHVEGEPPIVYGLRASLKEPSIFYAAGYFWKGERGGLNKISLGYFTKIGNNYRVVPADILWLLKLTRATPEAGVSMDAQLLRVLQAVSSSPPPPPPAPPAPPPTLSQNGPRITQPGAITATMLIKRVDPVYPPLARQTRISGTVRLHAIIDKDGSVLQLEAVSGHPLFVQSAMDAVKQWRYKPALLGGEPMQVDTTIDVIFSLNQ